MSLYNNINTQIERAASAAARLAGSGPLAARLGAMGAAAAQNAAAAALARHAAPQLQNALAVGAGVGAALAAGNWQGAAVQLIDSGMLGGLFGQLGAQLAAQSRYWGTPTPLLGGLSPREAKMLYDNMRGHTFAKKNLFLIEITSEWGGGFLNMPERFNLFATELNYTPFQIEAQPLNVGGAVVDAVTGAQAAALQLTTLDDAQGNLKRWFAAHHAAAASRDGTVGVPARYAIRIRVVHSFVKENAAAYEDLGLFRTENLELSLSRREDALQELNMGFVQLDTFMKP